MEVKKSHDLPSAGEPGKLWCNSVSVQRPKSRGDSGESPRWVRISWDPRAPMAEGRMDVSAKEEKILPSSAFCSIQALNRLDDTHAWRGWSSLLSLLIQTLFSSPSTPRDTLRYSAYQLSGRPLAQSRRHIKLTITQVYPSSTYYNLASLVVFPIIP